MQTMGFKVKQRKIKRQQIEAGKRMLKNMVDLAGFCTGFAYGRGLPAL
jgi:hypothetical protein